MPNRLTTLVVLIVVGVSLLSVPVAVGASLDEKLNRLLDMLGTRDFEDREKGQAQLLQLGMDDHEKVLDWAMVHYMSHRDPEVRYRLKEVIKGLVDEHVFNQKRGYMGVVLRPPRLPEVINGQLRYPLRVSVVLPNSTADLGSIKAGDLLVRVDDKGFDKDFTYSQLLNYINVHKPGDVLTFGVWREGKEEEVQVKLGEAPENPNKIPVEDQRVTFFENWFKSKYQLLRDKQEESN